jgi:hypothetical protein
MTRELRADPVDQTVAAYDHTGEEDNSGCPTSASGERLGVDEAEEARIPFPSLDNSGLSASA